MACVNKKMGSKGDKNRKSSALPHSLSITLAIKILLGTGIFDPIPARGDDDQWEWQNLGFAYDRFRLTLSQGTGAEAAGPLFGLEKAGTGTMFRFSPLFSLYRDSSIPQTEAELLYPILSFDKFGEEYRFQILQVISFAGGERLEGGEKERITLFPFYFQQRSANAEENYTALVPIYGRLQNRLFRDRVFFVMLPLYLQTEKRGMVTDNYLFPFFHLRHGEGVTGWQVWPLVGKESKEVTVRTNNWGEPVISGGYQKFMAVWPLFFRNTLGIGTTNLQKQLVLLPFYTSQISTSRVSKSYGWPLGYTHTIDHEKGYEEHDMPWPLIVFADGPGKTTKRIWPLFSQAKTPTLQSDFYAWPLYKYDRITSEPLDRERIRILLFLYSDLVERNTTSNTALRRRDFWPLFTWRRDHKDNERLQVFALLEPILPNNKSIERVYSPVYSIYRQERNGITGDQSRSFLWNLYRSDRYGETRRTSALFGLFQRERTPERTRWRLLFIPFSTGKAGRLAEPVE